MKISGPYSSLGEYHRNVNTSWRYYAVGVEKKRWIWSELKNLKNAKRIADLGCGEGLLVEELLKEGYDAIGMDKYYSSEIVKRGSMTKVPLKDASCDAVLSLDALEFLKTAEQKKALQEIKRILKKNGQVILTVPNKKHFAARVIKFLTGRFPWTDSKVFPPGDKGTEEYVAMIKESGLEIKKIRSILPTYFPISILLIIIFPKNFVWLLRIIDFFALNNLSFLNYIVAVKNE
jgi:cyclopropane fatty-acyl-phospholipid synthase-like methyltransferase